MKKVFFVSLILICISNHVFSQTVSKDDNFGENGIVPISNGGIEHLTFDEQSNIFAFGYADMGFPAVYKSNANGIIEKHFGTNGVVILDEYGPSNRGKRYGIKITKENKILIIFHVLSHYSEEPDDPPMSIIFRFNENGTPDESFGNNGEILLDNSSILAVNTENDEYMLIAYLASYDEGNEYIQKSYISKYNYKGEIDMDFGTDGKAYITSYQMCEFIPNSIKILKDNSIVLAGGEVTNSIVKLAFCKINQRGHFVTDFANNGIFVTNFYNTSWNYPKSLENVIETSNGSLMFTGWMTKDISGKNSASIFCVWF
ncbi:MAG: hypothetical protein LBE79_03510 [Tannerella sp.]|jgi:hypothetical protein|nr:hypothetical protein [Tannerella sp.]